MQGGGEMEDIIRVTRSTGEEIELPMTEELLQAVQRFTVEDEQRSCSDGTILNDLKKAWMAVFQRRDATLPSTTSAMVKV